MQVLGKGAFGTVSFAANKKSNQICACKSIDKAKLVSEVRLRSTSDRKMAQRVSKAPLSVALVFLGCLSSAARY